MKCDVAVDGEVVELTFLGDIDLNILVKSENYSWKIYPKDG